MRPIGTPRPRHGGAARRLQATRHVSVARRVPAAHDRISALAAALFVGLALLATACFDMTQEIALERDLSGTTAIDLTIDVDKMAYASAYMQKAFTGEQGPVTDQELAAARKELLAQVDEDEFDLEKQRPEIEADLPEGMRLLDARQERNGYKVHTHLSVAFDHIDRLRELDLAGRAEEMGEMAGDQARPFGNLLVVDEGNTILLTNAAPDPGADASADPMMQAMLGSLDDLMDRMLDGVHVVYRIQSPFTAVEHNATRVDGRTLVWEYDLGHLSGDGERPPDLMVRFRK